MSAKFRLSALVLVLIAAMTFAILPGFAQDTPGEEELTIVTGAVQFAPNGDIIVANTVIAPSGAFNPSTLQPGDVVIVIGALTADGTLKAISLELFDGDEPEATPEPTLEVTPEVTPEATLEITPEVTPQATTAPDSCNRPGHPVAQAIANTFGVPYEEVMAFHCAGNGFGNIVRAYMLAQASGGSAKDYIDRHKSGEGWGEIRKDSDVDPAELAPGRVLKPCKHGECETVQPTAEPQMDAGNGNNNGNPGNQDKDKDKDKGNNGNGNSNNNNNGNGNGNKGGKKK
jgi:hypothetical protein